MDYLNNKNNSFSKIMLKMLLCICAAYTTCVSNKCIYLISPFPLQIFCQSPDQPCSYSDKNYSQTCSNGQLYKTTTCLRWPKLSPPKPILIQLLLHNKMTTCLMQPAITFFVPQIKKKLSKTATAKLHPAEKWEVVCKK